MLIPRCGQWTVRRPVTAPAIWSRPITLDDREKLGIRGKRVQVSAHKDVTEAELEKAINPDLHNLNEFMREYPRCS